MGIKTSCKQDQHEYCLDDDTQFILPLPITAHAHKGPNIFINFSDYFHELLRVDDSLGIQLFLNNIPALHPSSETRVNHTRPKGLLIN